MNGLDHSYTHACVCEWTGPPRFNVIDSKTLEETVTQLKPSTCCLDALPTSFFKNVLHCLEIDVLQIVNSSLQSDNFPKALSRA